MVARHGHARDNALSVDVGKRHDYRGSLLVEVLIGILSCGQILADKAGRPRTPLSVFGVVEAVGVHCKQENQQGEETQGEGADGVRCPH